MTTYVAYDLAAENFFSMVGNAYDIVGAILLARALAFVRPNDLEKQATSGYGGFSGPLLKMFAEQKVDAIFGLALLIAGFALQVLAGYGLKSTSFEFVACFGILLGLVLLVYFAARKRLTKRFFVRALRSLRDQDNRQQRLPESTIEKLWQDS